MLRKGNVGFVPTMSAHSLRKLVTANLLKLSRVFNVRFFKARVTNSRQTFLFFILILIHFVIQVSLQFLMLDVDSTKMSTISNFANLPHGIFVSVEPQGSLTLVKACNESTSLEGPSINGSMPCPVIYTAGGNGGNTTIVASGALALVGGPKTLCDLVLLWPYQTFHNEIRTDGSFIGMESWLLLVSVLAILHESIPHLIASLVIHLLSTVWSFWTIFETQRHQRIYNAIVTNGACSLFSSDPGFLGGMGDLFTERTALDIVVFLMNLVMLVALCVLGLFIYRLFSQQQFDRVGTSRDLQRIYRFVLWLSASFQLSFFVLITSTALWIDQLFVADFHIFDTEHIPVYQGIFISTLVILVPWHISGHVAVRKEIKWLMLAFLGVCIGLLGSWGFMFFSDTFQVSFMTWSFFAVMVIAAFSLILMTFIVGVICLRNFGVGLVHFLHVRRVLADSDFPAENFTIEPANETVKSFVQQPEPFKINLSEYDEDRKSYDEDFKVISVV